MGAGRPTDYKPEYVKLAYNYCLLSAKDEDLAHYFDIAVSTLNEWKIKYPEFAESIRDGRERADANVANSLHNRAMGYKQKVTKVMQYQGVPIEVEVEEDVPPDTTAAIFWLKNRQGKNWRDKQDVAVTIEEDIDTDAINARIKELINSLTPEEKAALSAD